ncbi:MAG: hypothetical protein KGO21_12600 [Hyphomicrobiales bacterium]|nr:hypothetical protein [Hyphomicrobiales bacterium]
MQEKSLDETKSSYQYSFSIAVILTVLIIVFAVLIWTGVFHIPASPYESQYSGLNKGFNIVDFGTYVSGIFSTLSFIWLVVNAIQQREDLKLQRKEMKENNEHQKKQADQLADTAEINRRNLEIQREIYANEKIIPHIRTVYYYLILHGPSIRIQFDLDYIAEISKYISLPDRSDPFVALFPSHFSVEMEFKEADEISKIVFRYNMIMIRFIQLSNSLERCLKHNPDSIVRIERFNKLNTLKAQFLIMEEILKWLNTDYAKIIRELYRLEEITKFFNILDALPESKKQFFDEFADK